MSRSWDELVRDQNELEGKQNKLNEQFREYFNEHEHSPEELMELCDELPPCSTRFFIIRKVERVFPEYYEENFLKPSRERS